MTEPSDSEETATLVSNTGNAHGGDLTADLSDDNGEPVGESAIAGGLCSLIYSAMKNFDCRAEAAGRSQDKLALSLDRLTGELDKLLEDAPSPFVMQQAARISGVRNRVKALNNVLKSIQRRIDDMDLMLSAGVLHESVRENNEQIAFTKLR